MDSPITKRKYELLSLEDRINVIKQNQLGLSHRKLAEKFKCGKTQITRILKNKETLQEEWDENGASNVKRKRKPVYDKINKLVWEWFQKARAKHYLITGPLIQEKAREFAALSDETNFSASNGWLESFRKRHSIVFRAANRVNAPTNAQIGRNWTERVPSVSVIQNYSLRDVYTFGETGLLFRALPDETLIEKGKNWSAGKMSKERLTICLCCNAMGGKELPLVVGDCARPSPSVVNPGIKWKANKSV